MIDRLSIRVCGEKQYQYILNQEDVEYDKVISTSSVIDGFRSDRLCLDELQSYQRRFGDPFLQRYILSDRELNSLTHENQLRYIIRWFKFYDEYFKRFNPDLVITDGIASAAVLIPFRMVRDAGGHGVWWHSTRVNNIHEFVTDSASEDFDEIHRLFDQINSGKKDIYEIEGSMRKAKQYIQDFRQASESNKSTLRNLAYYNRFDKLQRQLAKLTIRKVLLLLPRYIRYYYLYNISSGGNIKKEDITRPSTSQRILKDLTQAYRQTAINYLNKFQSPDYNQDYIYFPLHLQPEYSTLVLNQKYSNQIDVVRDLSKNIPSTYKLYVKEHPNMSEFKGWRSLDYYNRLKSMSNVKLIHPDINSQDIIKESELVATISGTAGLEALLHKRPVIVIGNPHYRKIPLTYTCDSPKFISDTVKTAINSYDHDDKIVINYLTSIFHKGFKIPSSNEHSPKEFAETKANAILPNLIKRIKKIEDMNG
jgi:hypothetical protein